MTRGEITNWPEDRERMRELMLYSFRVQSDIDRIKKEQEKNPFSILKIPSECREWEPKEFMHYLKNKHTGDNAT